VARKQNKPIKPTRNNKLILAVLVHKLKRHTHRSTQQLREIVRILSPKRLCWLLRNRISNSPDRNGLQPQPQFGCPPL
jgi:hypothetical protein